MCLQVQNWKLVISLRRNKQTNKENKENRENKERKDTLHQFFGLSFVDQSCLEQPFHGMFKLSCKFVSVFTDSYSIQRSYRGLCWLRHWCWCGQSAPRQPSTSRLVSASGPFLGSFRLQGRNWKMILWISSWVCGHKSSSQATDSEHCLQDTLDVTDLARLLLFSSPCIAKRCSSSQSVPGSGQSIQSNI